MRSILPAICAIAAATATAAGAETHIIEQDGLTFVPDVVVVNPGDTIIWNRNSGSHDVVNGLPCNEFSEPIFEAMLLNGSNPVAEWTVPDACYGEVPYFCSVGNHCQQGMVAMILVEPPKGATVHEVAQQGVNFIPEEITVAPGDIVRWTWNNGGHTASSGDIPTCTEDNVYFNLLLDDQHTSGLWVVPESMPDVLDYLCIYHCELAHIGKIIKKADECIGDLNNDGKVDGADLTALLGGWGSDGAGDLTDDGQIDGADLTLLLGNWGDC